MPTFLTKKPVGVTFVVFFAITLNPYLDTVSSANILVYGIFGSYSQRISMWPFIESLADRGHNITFVSSFESKDPHPKVHDYAPRKWRKTLGDWNDRLSFYEIRKQKQMIKTWFRLPHIAILSCEMLYEDEEFRIWLKSSQFDLVIMDSLLNECVLGMVHIFKAKLISYSTTKPRAWDADIYGMPDESSSISDVMFNFPCGTDMSFHQRFLTALLPLTWKVIREFWYLPRLEEITKQGLGLEEIPPFTEIEKRTSLFMMTTHYALDYARSLSPNAMTVGGVGVFEDIQPIPKEMLEFVEMARNGFVYISFGSVAEFANFDYSVQQEFIKGIKKFRHIKFVWKSASPLSDVGDNVFVTKWAPQLSLLAHRNIKAFVTHAGMGSATEAVYYGVPLIMFPVLAEQDMNADTLSARGAGIKLEITTLKEQELTEALSDILNNSKYRAAMKTMSEFFRDRPTSATENAVWWTEFVLRHDDVNDFLQPLSSRQSWWIKRQIDVWVVFSILIVILTLTPIYIIYRNVKALVRRLFSLSRMKDKIN